MTHAPTARLLGTLLTTLACSADGGECACARAPT